MAVTVKREQRRRNTEEMDLGDRIENIADRVENKAGENARGVYFALSTF